LIYQLSQPPTFNYRFECPVFDSIKIRNTPNLIKTVEYRPFLSEYQGHLKERPDYQ